MVWKVEFSEKARKNLEKLDPVVAGRILKFLHKRVAEHSNPRAFGQSLTGGQLGTLWKYRIGDYRVIADIQDGCLMVLVVRIGHRREVYRV